MYTVIYSRNPTLCGNCAKSCAMNLGESFQLLRISVTTRSVRSGDDEANHCIIVVWRQYATPHPICAISMRSWLSRVICEHRVYKLLGDDTALPAIPSEDRFWIIDEWFPRAVKCGLRFAASKQPDAHFGRVAVTHIQSAAPGRPGSAEPSRSWKKRGNGSIATHRNGDRGKSTSQVGRSTLNSGSRQE